jgi:auxin response factor
VFVLFPNRGNDGELTLGVRRAVPLKNEVLIEAVNSTNSKLRTLSAVGRSIFHICFNPRYVHCAQYIH